MNASPRLVVDMSSVELRGISPAVGNIWLQTDRWVYPDVGWSDFVVVIVGWWAEALVRLSSGQSTEELIHFMEGPYAVRCVRVTSDQMRLIRLRSSLSEMGSHVEVGLREFARTVVDIGDALVRMGRAEEVVEASDLRRLRESVTTLKAVWINAS